MSETATFTEAIDTVLTDGPVIPVVVIDDAEHAVPLARALLRGNLSVIEVTLRTPAGIAAIERIARDVPEIRVGAGTVTSVEEVTAATAAGAQFLVLPGSPEALLDAAIASGAPVLPAASSATEAMRLLDHGITAVKFFPASVCGGPAFLAAIAGPLPQVRWCPTGGITQANAPDYLTLANVLCVGASWVTPRDRIAAEDWDAITEIATTASALRT